MQRLVGALIGALAAALLLLLTADQHGFEVYRCPAAVGQGGRSPPVSFLTRRAVDCRSVERWL
jgi:hypothetical protein